MKTLITLLVVIGMTNVSFFGHNYDQMNIQLAEYMMPPNGITQPNDVHFTKSEMNDLLLNKTVEKRKQAGFSEYRYRLHGPFIFETVPMLVKKYSLKDISIQEEITDRTLVMDEVSGTNITGHILMVLMVIFFFFWTHFFTVRLKKSNFEDNLGWLMTLGVISTTITLLPVEYHAGGLAILIAILSIVSLFRAENGLALPATTLIAMLSFFLRITDEKGRLIFLGLLIILSGAILLYSHHSKAVEKSHKRRLAVS